MRNRKYLIGALVGVIGALTFTSVASAGPVSQSLTTTLSPTKQDRKLFGGVSLKNDIRTNYSGFDSPPRQTVFTIDPNVKFVAGNIPVCPLASVQNKPDAAARAACPQSITGQGTVEAQGSLGTLNGTVTFFRGDSAANQDILVHTVVGGALILDIIGDINGRTLTFTNLPNTGTQVLTDFNTTFNKRKTGKMTVKVAGKKKKLPTFYVMARCKTGKWSTTETTTFYNGQTLSASSSGKCKKSKKK
jgi:hypothetical protein